MKVKEAIMGRISQDIPVNEYTSRQSKRKPSE
jgi:protein phosphatase 2C family protein 2/3